MFHIHIAQLAILLYECADHQSHTLPENFPLGINLAPHRLLGVQASCLKHREHTTSLTVVLW